MAPRARCRSDRVDPGRCRSCAPALRALPRSRRSTSWPRQFLGVEARWLLLDGYMAQVIDQGGPGKVPTAWGERQRHDRLAGDLGSKLGLDSSGRASLRQSAGSTEATLADLAAQGRQTSGYRARMGDDPDDGAA